MKKKFKSVLCLTLSLVLILGTVAPVLAAKPAAEPEGPFTQEDFLTTRKRKIVNQRGETIRLKGVNLGGWLI